jgi:atypical dual specificity phosphatase
MIEEENIPRSDLLTFAPDHGVESLQNIHIDWRDMSTPQRRDIERMLAEVKKYMDENPSKAVVFHCYAGKGRTGTAIAAFLIKYHGMGGVEAINHVRQSRKGSIETREQERWLVDYFNSLHTDREPEAYLNQ